MAINTAALNGLRIAAGGIRKGYRDEQAYQQGQQEHDEDREHLETTRRQQEHDWAQQAPLKDLAARVEQLNMEQAIRLHGENEQNDKKKLANEFVQLQNQKNGLIYQRALMDGPGAAELINSSPEFGVTTASDVIMEPIEKDGETTNIMRVVDKDGNSVVGKGGHPLEFNADLLDALYGSTKGGRGRTGNKDSWHVNPKAGIKYNARTGTVEKLDDGLVDEEAYRPKGRTPSRGPAGKWVELDDGRMYNPTTDTYRTPGARPKHNTRGGLSGGLNAGVTKLKNGQFVRESDMQKRYNSMYTDPIRGKVKDAPSYDQWHDEQADPEYAFSGGANAEQASPPQQRPAAGIKRRRRPVSAENRAEQQKDLDGFLENAKQNLDPSSGIKPEDLDHAEYDPEVGYVIVTKDGKKFGVGE